MTGAEQDAAVDPTASDGGSAPLLRIVRGDATPEEVAALVAVVASLGAPEAPAKPRRPEWNAPRRLVRRPLHPGRGGWRASALPR